MATTKDIIARNFRRGIWTEDMLKKLILKGKLSYDEYTQIVGADIDVSALSAAETRKLYTTIIQNHLDSKAAELGYDDCNSVCTYVDTGVRKFDTEGAAFRIWRSAVWTRGYQILDECLAGSAVIPSPEEFVGLLPALVIMYGEEA